MVLHYLSVGCGMHFERGQNPNLAAGMQLPRLTWAAGTTGLALPYSECACCMKLQTMCGLEDDCHFYRC
jgi:hypothetical protein